MDETNEAYHADTKWVSKSMLSVFAKSRREYFARFVAKTKPAEPPSPSMEKGTLAHLAILEPQRYMQEYVVAPAWTRASKKAFETWAADATKDNDLKCLTVDQHREMVAMRKAAETIAGPLLDAPGKVECSLRWMDPESGLGLKCRVDKLLEVAKPVVLDLKTTFDMSARQFFYTSRKFDYGIQQVHYSDGVRHETGLVPQFYFLVVGTSKPYAAGLYVLPEKEVSAARVKWRFLLNALAECYASGNWDEGAIETPVELAGW